MMPIDQLRTDICRVGRSLFERGYVHGSAGNISVRISPQLGGGILITPTDACLGFLEPDALAWVDDAGAQTSGQRASKTVLLHRRIYEADARVQCVVHTHSSHLVQLGLQGVWREQEILPPITPYFVMKVGAVPLVAYRRPGDPATADAVAQAIADAVAGGRRLRAVMLDRLGPLVWSDSPMNAMATLEELEETARLWLACDPRPEPLTPAQVEELQRHFPVNP